MKITTVAIGLLWISVACGGDSTGLDIETLQNDDFTSGNTPAFQSGFATGEAAAVRLGPRSAAFTITHVRFLFGGAAGDKTITLTIYPDGGSLNPGTAIHSDDYTLTASDNAMQDIDLTGDSVQVAANQTIRIAIAFQHDGLPSVARDGAITSARNLVRVNPGTWTAAETVGINGDFVIRAEISTP